MKIIIIRFTMTLPQATLSIQGGTLSIQGGRVVVVTLAVDRVARPAGIPRTAIVAMIMVQLIKAERLHGELFSFYKGNYKKL